MAEKSFPTTPKDKLPSPLHRGVNQNRRNSGNRMHLMDSQASSKLRPIGAQRKPPIESLHHVFQDSMDRMSPGDILLLDDNESLRDLVDPIFFAILSCPLCGKLDLITQSQYSGTESVICGYDDCSCHFRIDHKQALIYLPVN